MLRDWLLFGSVLVVAGACTRVPADVSTPKPEVEPSAAEPEPEPDAPASAAASVPEGCVATELTVCLESCDDAECLEWCGGQACVTAVENAAACLDQFAIDEPRPQLVYEIRTDAQGKFKVPTQESLARQMEWDDQRAQRMGDHWFKACHAGCIEQLGSDADMPGGFCRNWRDHQSDMKLVTGAATDESQISGLFGASLIGVLGTNLRLTGELADQQQDTNSRALSQMIFSASERLENTEDCIPTLTQQGEIFVVELEFGPRGEVVAATVPDGSAEGECVARVVAKAIAVPSRVAHAFPHIEVAVDVRLPSGLGWGLGGMGGSGTDGVSGLGSTGWGEGGGGGEPIVDEFGTVGRGGGGTVGGLGTISGTAAGSKTGAETEAADDDR